MFRTRVVDFTLWEKVRRVFVVVISAGGQQRRLAIPLSRQILRVWRGRFLSPANWFGRIFPGWAARMLPSFEHWRRTAADHRPLGSVPKLAPRAVCYRPVGRREGASRSASDPAPPAIGLST